MQQDKAAKDRQGHRQPPLAQVALTSSSTSDIGLVRATNSLERENRAYCFWGWSCGGSGRNQPAGGSARRRILLAKLAQRC